MSKTQVTISQSGKTPAVIKTISKGQTVIVHAKDGARYELQDLAQAQKGGIPGVKFQRVGKDLHILLENEDKANLVIEDYYGVFTEGVNAVVGQAESGVMYEYSTTTGQVGGMTEQAGAVSASLSAQTVPLAPVTPTGMGLDSMLAAGAGLVAVAAAAWGGKGKAKDQDLVIQGEVVAGPVHSGITVYAYDDQGQLLGQTVVDAQGQWRIDVPLRGDYKGVVLVKVEDTNSSETNYKDEVTGQDKSMGATLRVMAAQTDANVTQVGEQRVLTVSVSPVTELAVRQAGISLEDTKAPSTEQAQKFNTEVANALGLEGVDITGSAVATNSSAFKSEDGLNSAEKYGILLTKLSGLDKVNGGSIDTSLQQLSAKLSEQAPSQALLEQGRQEALKALQNNVEGAVFVENTLLNRQLLGEVLITQQALDKDGKLVIEGTALPGSTVNVTTATGTQQVTANAQGTFTLTTEQNLSLLNAPLSVVGQDGMGQNATSSIALKPAITQATSVTPEAMGTLGAEQVSGISTQALGGMTGAQIAALSPEAFAALTPAQLAALSVDAIAGLTAAQLATLTPEEKAVLGTDHVVPFSAMTPAQFAALTAAQLAAMSSTDVAALSSEIIGSLTAAQVAAFSPEGIQGLSPDDLDALTEAAVGGLTPAQLASLSPSEVAALGTDIANLSAATMGAMTPEQFAALSMGQVAALGGDDVAALSEAVIASMGAAQVAALSTSAFAGLSQGGLAALSAQGVSGMTPAQVGTLSPSEVAALGTDVANLNTAAMGSLTPEQFAGLTTAQIAALGSEDVDALSNAVIASLTAAQVAALSTTGIEGLSTADLDALSSAAVSGITAAQVPTLSPAEVAALGTDVANMNAAAMGALTPAQFAGLTTAQIAALGSEDVAALSNAVIASLTAAQVAALSTTGIEGLSTADLDALSSEAVSGITAAQVATLSPAEMAALGTDVANMNATAVGALTPEQFAGLTTAQIAALGSEDVSALSNAVVTSLTAAQVAALSTTGIEGLSTDDLDALSSEAVSGITAEQVATLSPAELAALGTDVANMNAGAVAALTPEQFAGLTTAQIAALGSEDVSALSNAVISSLTAAQVAALSTTGIEGLSTDDLGALSSEAVSGITPAQVPTLSPAEMAALGTDIANMNAGAVATLTSEQVAALTTEQIAALGSEDVAALTSAAVTGLSSAQVAALSTDAFGALGIDDLGALTSEAVAGITAAQVTTLETPEEVTALGTDIANLGSAAMAALTSVQVEALTSEQVAALGSEDLAAMSSTAFTGLSSADLGTLTSAAVQGITGEQIDTLETPEEITALGTDVANLNTAALASLTSAQVAALTTEQIAALGSEDVAALTSEALQGLTSAQVAALTTAAFGALGTDDLGALTSEAVAGITAAQVATLETPEEVTALGTDIANLGSAAMAALTSTQVAALTTAQFAALDTADLDALSSTAVAGITVDQVATLNATEIDALGTDIANLGTAALAALTSAQVAALSTAQFAALDTADLAALTSAAVAGITVDQVATLNATEIDALGTDIANLGTAAIAALTSQQVAVLTTAQFAALDTADLAALTSAAVAGITVDQVATLDAAEIDALGTDIANLGTATLAALTSTQVAALSTAQFAALDTADLAALTSSAVAGITVDQVATLDAAEIAALGTDIANLGTAALAALTSTQVAALTTVQFAALDTADLAALSSSAVAGITVDQVATLEATEIEALGTDIANLGAAAMAALTSAQVEALSTAQFAALDTADLGALSSEAVSGITVDQVATLDAAEVVALGTDIANLGTAAMGALTSVQVAALSTEQFAALDTADLAALSSSAVQGITSEQIDTLNAAEIAALGTDIANLGSAALASLNSEQIAALTTDQIAALGSDDVAALTSAALVGLTSAQVAALSTAAFAALGTDDLEALTGDAVQGITAAQVATLETTAEVTALGTDIANMGTAAMGALTSTQVAALTTVQFAALDTADLAALTSEAVQGITVDQVATLDAADIEALGTDIANIGTAAMAALTSTQVAAMTTAQFAALDTADLAALTSAAVVGITVDQVATLNAAEIAALGTDIANIGTAAMAALTSAQVAALTTAQFDALDNADLEALSSSAVQGVTAAQVDTLSTSDVVALGTDIANMATAAMASLDSAQVAALSTAQFEALATDDLTALSSEAVAGVTASQADSLDAADIAALGTDIANLNSDAMASLDSTQIAALSNTQVAAFGAEDYAALGVTNVSSGAQTSLLQNVTSLKASSAVNETPELQALANATDAVMDVAALANTAVTPDDAALATFMAQLNLIGVTGVTPENIASVWQAVRNTADAGTGVDTLAKIDALVATANDKPTLANGGNTLAYNENDAATAINTLITVADADNTTLTSATVTISTGFVAGQDVLSFVNASMGNIAGSYANGVMTLSSAGGSATLAQWQAALRAVTYSNTSETPNTDTRTLSYSVNDGSLNSSVLTSSVSVTAVNDQPLSNADGSSFANLYVGLEDQPAPVNGTQVGSLIADSNYFAGKDPEGLALGLAIVEPVPTSKGTAWYSLDDGATWLNLSTATATASMTNAFVLASSARLYFQGITNADNSMGMFKGRLWDGTDGATSGQSKDISTLTGATGAYSAHDYKLYFVLTPVNDAPALATTSTLNYTENGAAAAINNALTVTDVDNTALTTATVKITDGYVAGQDVLGFVANAGTMGNIAGVVSGDTVTLTSAGGTATLAQWQVALRAVTYSNTSDAPTTAARTVSYVINDTALASTPLTSTINVTAANDAPVLDNSHNLSLPTAMQGGAAPADGSAVGMLVSDLAVGSTDVDAGATQGIAITGFNTGGKLWISLDGGATWTEQTSVSVSSAVGLIADADNRVYYQPGAAQSGTVADALTFKAWDRVGGATDGTRIDATTGGGTTAFSTASDTVSQYVVKAVTINAVSTDNIVTPSENLVISGTAEQNATVTLSVAGQSFDVVANASGNWSYDGNQVRYIMVRKDLKNTPYSGTADVQTNAIWNIAEVRAMDGATNRAATSTVTFDPNFTKDTIAPSAAVALVDGDASSIIEVLGSSYAGSDRDVWVQLDLGASYDLSAIEVVGRSGGFAERLNGSVVYTSTHDMSGMTRAQLDAAFNVNSAVVAVNNDQLTFTVTDPASAKALDLVEGQNIITASETVQSLQSSATRAVTVPSTSSVWRWSNNFDGADPSAGAIFTGTGAAVGNAANSIGNADGSADNDNELKILNDGILPSYRPNSFVPGANQIVTNFDVAFDMNVSAMTAVNTTTNRFELRYITANSKMLRVMFHENGIGVIYDGGANRVVTGPTNIGLSARNTDRATVTMAEDGMLTVTLAGGGPARSWTANISDWETVNSAGGRFLFYGDSATGNPAAPSSGWIDNIEINSTVVSSVVLPTVSNVSVSDNSADPLVFVPKASGTGSVAITDDTPRLQGTSKPGSTVKVYEGLTLLGTATADATTGEWFLDTAALTIGAHTLDIRATDTAGNVGENTQISLLVNSTTSTWTWSDNFDNPIDPMAGASWTTSGYTGSNAYVVDTNADGDKEAKFLNGASTSSLWQDTRNVLSSNQRISAFTAAHDFDMTSAGDKFQFRLREQATGKGLVVSFDTNADNTATDVVFMWNGVAFKTQALTTTLTSRVVDRITYEMTANGELTVTLAGAGNTTETITATVPNDAWTTQTMAGFAYGVYAWTGALAGQGWIDNVAITSEVKSTKLLPTATITQVMDDVVSTTALSNGATTDDNLPTLMGTATPGSIVKLYDGDFYLGQVAANQTTGVWTFDMAGGLGMYTGYTSNPLSSGLHTLKVRAMDADGNLGEANSFNLMVDTTAPSVTSVAFAGNSGMVNNTLNEGDTVTVSLNMSESVTVTGAPQLTLNIGATPVLATYDSASSTATSLKFKYTILAGQTDANGISVSSNALALNGASIVDAAGFSTNMTLPVLTESANLVVGGGMASGAGWTFTAPTQILTTINSSLTSGPFADTNSMGAIRVYDDNYTGNNAIYGTGTTFTAGQSYTLAFDAEQLGVSLTDVANFKWQLVNATTNAFVQDITGWYRTGGANGPQAGAYLLTADTWENFTNTFTVASTGNYKLALYTSLGGTTPMGSDYAIDRVYLSTPSYMVDTTAPTLVSTSPVDGSATMNAASNLTLNFSETVVKGTGTIGIYKLSDNSLVESFDVASSSRITGWNGTTLTIDPTSNLANTTGHYVKIGATAIKDAAGNAYAGIANNSAFNFMTLNADGSTPQGPALTVTNLTTTLGSALDSGSTLLSSASSGNTLTSNFGTRLTAMGDDSSLQQSFGSTTFGGSIKLFGVDYTGVYVSSNGFVTFGASKSSYSGENLNAWQHNFPVIAAFLVDIDENKNTKTLSVGGNSTGTGDAWYRQEANGFMVTYDDVSPYSLLYPPTDGTNYGNAFQIKVVQSQLNGKNYQTIELVYENISWAKGNSSDIPQAGWSAGSAFPGQPHNTPTWSGSVADALAQAETASNINRPGVWRWVVDGNTGQQLDVNASTAANTFADTAVTVAALGSNASGTAQYALVNDSNGRFVLDTGTNPVTVKTVVGAAFDSSEATATVTVRVTDSATGLSTDQALTVNLSDRFGNASNNTIGLRSDAEVTELNGTPILRIDGGAGFDSLKLHGAGRSLNLSTVEDVVIKNIEKIDLSATGAQTLTLNNADVSAMSATNLIRTGSASADGNTWTNASGTALGATTAYSQLVVDGTSADTLNFASGGAGVWSSVGVANNGTSNYTVYQNTTTNSQVLVQSGVVVVLPEPTPTVVGEGVRNEPNSTGLGWAFSAANFTYGFADVAGQSDTPSKFIITALPQGGATLKIGGINAVVGQEYSISAWQEVLMFRVAGQSGEVSFKYKLKDSGATNNLTNEVTMGYNYTKAGVAPVVLDLNGDGTLAYSQVAMDVNGDGHLDQTAWAGAQDGVLVWDKTGDGVVRDASQYAFTQYGGQTDLQGLAAGFDSNGDGVFDAADAKFAEFTVWQDANQNGVSDAGEVRSLADVGVTRIDLSSDGVQRSPADGVNEAGRTTAQLADGREMLVADAEFAYSDLSYRVNAEGDLSLLGEQMNLDLSSLVSVHGALHSVDLSGTGANSLKISLRDLLSLGEQQPLRVLGDADDSVELDAAQWTASGSAQAEGHSYAVYAASNGQQLWLDQQIHMA